MDLAAQASKGGLCEKCFATVEAGAPYCPECGAPMGEAAGSDGEIYPLLARANLLRMRGEYKQAETVCLSILKRFPNNASTNTLLGDICAERGDLEEAEKWYEMALEIVPDSAVDQEKLANLRKRIHDRDKAATAVQIGIRERTKSPMLWPTVIAVVLMSGVGIGAYMMGSKSRPESARSRVDVSGAGIPQEDQGAREPASGDEPVASPPLGAWSDPQLTSLLQTSLGDTATVADAWMHPTTSEVLMTVNAQPEADVRALAGRVGVAALEQVPNALVVTVRVVQDGKLALVADVDRAAFQSITVPAGTDMFTQPGILDQLLKNEWPARANASEPPPNPAGNAAPSPSPGGGSPPNTTSTTTAGGVSPGNATTGAGQ